MQYCEINKIGLVMDYPQQHPQNEIKNIIDILCQTNVDNPVDWSGDLNTLCSRNISTTEATSKFDTSIEIPDLVPVLKKYNPDDNSGQWKYICLNFYYLSLLREILENTPDSEHLSVQQTHQLKNVIRNVVGIGIASNLLPTLPYYTKLPSEKAVSDEVSVFTRYKRLAGTTYGIITGFCRCSHLKPLILPSAKWVLSAVYQINYAPIKKPDNEPDTNGFVMTEDIYNNLIKDRKIFNRLLNEFACSMHINLYVRDTMMLTGTFSSENKAVHAPIWMQKAVYSTLRMTICGPKGIESVAWALLDATGLDYSDDTTKSWKTLDVIAKMIIDCWKIPHFRENISGKLNSLLKVRNSSGQPIKPFERLFTLCMKLFFQQDESFCQEVFIKHLPKPLICFTNEEHNLPSDENITESLSQTMRLLNSLFVGCSFNIPALPVHTLTTVINVMFHVYAVTLDASALKELNSDIKDVLVKVLQELEMNLKFAALDSFLFGISNENFLKLRSDIEIVVENNTLNVKHNDYTVKFRPSKCGEIIKRLLKEELSLYIIFFNYLLNCLINREKYFKISSTNQDLLHLEEGFVLIDVLERKFVVHKLLIELSEDPTVRKYNSENPSDVIRCLQTLFVKTLEAKVHKTTDFDSEEFQTLFVIVTLLEVLLEKSSKGTLSQYKDLIEPLEVIFRECNNAELKKTAKRILLKMKEGVEEKVTSKDESATTKTLLDKALEDICDPLLPTRGHGLMTLAKLVEKKDKCALERKQYILNIFQLNLKNEDSYIYLNAISGLAAMGDIFPDTVLNVLAEEYSKFSRNDSEDGHEVRMKVGEVLVRVTKMLGEMAPKYKSLLLNTFLVGTKDEDHLIRASSLSNLGEVCRVLGYKLGSIVTEVLVCVHAIITTDKAVEARRAAVTVIRQLFVGLEKEMIAFLKDDILPVYRTLKNIYTNDPDDVMRLQAQLALEELNENMKGFVFPNPQLNTDKKFVILN